MPHAIIEHSDLDEIGISSPVLLQSVSGAMSESALFDLEDIKVRRHACDAMLNGTNNFSFIHVQLRIMPGRTTEQKASLSSGVLAAISALEGQARSTSVEVVDIDRSTYSKTVL